MYFCFKRLHMAYLTFFKGKIRLKTFFSNAEKTINVRLTLFWLYSHTNLSKQQELGTANHICKNEVRECSLNMPRGGSGSNQNIDGKKCGPTPKPSMKFSAHSYNSSKICEPTQEFETLKINW